ncbi:Uncharacterized protein TPAR_05960 [Tolypocladium paradoxum]|uniref:Uncharacterized protein n=1 Tax=Tolypocladium paradoxum TaxID=94208 RepID=A0A2S4KUJ9_9HYPO|nr:Uncharacterized protein TPAR_05960 [Tolypocladium paradoxum]
MARRHKHGQAEAEERVRLSSTYHYQRSGSRVRSAVYPAAPAVPNSTVDPPTEDTRGRARRNLLQSLASTSSVPTVQAVVGAVSFPRACHRTANRARRTKLPDHGSGRDAASLATMGACQSCLGRRDRDDYDEGEESRLLYEDGNGMQYGSFGDPAMGGDDTVEAQRENEALQRVVAKTSNNMVDVFEIAPHDSSRGSTSTPFAYAGQGARVARYQHLVSKLSADEDGDAAGVRVDWLAEDDVDELQGNGPESIQTLVDGNGGPLVGTFADAAAAMQ